MGIARVTGSKAHWSIQLLLRIHPPPVATRLPSGGGCAVTACRGSHLGTRLRFRTQAQKKEPRQRKLRHLSWLPVFADQSAKPRTDNEAQNTGNTVVVRS